MEVVGDLLVRDGVTHAMIGGTWFAESPWRGGAMDDSKSNDSPSEQSNMVQGQRSHGPLTRDPTEQQPSLLGRKIKCTVRNSADSNDSRTRTVQGRLVCIDRL
jgi:hypothetical protein